MNFGSKLRLRKWHDNDKIECFLSRLSQPSDVKDSDLADATIPLTRKNTSLKSFGISVLV